MAVIIDQGSGHHCENAQRALGSNLRGFTMYLLQTADSVVSMYTKALAASESVQGTVVGLHYLEQTTNKEDGSRFLLEMNVQLHQPQEELVHTSEYVYLKKGTTHLCHTSNFQWRPKVDVHLVVSGKFFMPAGTPC